MCIVRNGLHGACRTPLHSAQVSAIRETRPDPKPLLGEGKRIHGDAGYLGIHKRDEHEGREVEWHIAARPGRRKVMAEDSDDLKAEQAKASVRAKVEHPFRWVKGIFGYNKVRYRGLDKNMNRLCLLLGFTNLLRSRSLGYTG
ncbi:MAG: hypothetical protein CO062_11520 [Zetaproteobacteria bacterium CG_4_9_14_0_2_um_filter_59_191]|nr:MAG: hypothetical protein CO062_11520 [Zetaproteobacteria bacterium CG_4_9_14_0_2_um_filter_59_191]